MKKYENFCLALKNLKDIFQVEEPYDNITLTGQVSLYSICFEQAWKAMKFFLEQSGVPEGKTGSPKQILKAAYGAGMIRQEEIWMEALISRNNAAHAYNSAIALDIVRKTKNAYYEMFCQLKDELEANWVI